MEKYTIKQFAADYPDDDACLDKIFQLRYSNLVCKCGAEKTFHKVKNRRSYQCSNCGFQIYPTQGTIFEKSTTPLTSWFFCIYLHSTSRNGLAAKEIERQLNVCYHTALRISHQLKKLMANKSTSPLSGIIEADESWFGMSVRNMHTAKRAEFAQSGKKNALDNKTTVLGMLERNGRVITKVIDKATLENIDLHIRENVEFASQLFTDAAQMYKSFNDAYYHHSVNHNDNEFVRGKVHTNTIESYWSHLKRTIKGTHIHVSVKHLPKYMDEVSFKWQHKDSKGKMFDIILDQIAS